MQSTFCRGGTRFRYRELKISRGFDILSLDSSEIEEERGEGERVGSRDAGRLEARCFALIKNNPPLAIVYAVCAGDYTATVEGQREFGRNSASSTTGTTTTTTYPPNRLN